LSKLLLNVAAAPEKYAGARRCAAEWAQQYSLEGLQEAIRKLLLSHWSEAAAPPVAGRAAADEK
ncbi:MAG TPA: hypothetical protein VGL97_25590, partial [Bryobacteraceae bacterium]